MHFLRAYLEETFVEFAKVMLANHQASVNQL